MRERRRSMGVPTYLAPAGARRAGLSPVVWSVVLCAAFAVGVELYARLVLTNNIDLVPVSTMASEAWTLVRDRDFMVDSVAHSLLIVASCVAIAVAWGIAAAGLMWRSTWVAAALRPAIAVFYAVPIFALYPILVVLFGTGSQPIIVLVGLFSGVVVVAHAYTGFSSVPAAVDKLARSYRLHRVAYIRHVLLPSALPDLMTGVKLCATYAFVGVLATEFILSTQGLGNFVSTAYETFSTGPMYGAIFVAVVLALAFNLAVAFVCGRLDWRRHERG